MSTEPTLTASEMSEGKCGGWANSGIPSVEFNLADVVATHPRIVDTEDIDRSEEVLVVCLVVTEADFGVAEENHDDVCLDIALHSLSLNDRMGQLMITSITVLYVCTHRRLVIGEGQ